VIELRGVTRTFDVGGRPVHALRSVDLDVADGDYVSVMGPSGSGKSTLLNLLGCLDRPDAGSYQLDGEEAARLDEEELSHVRRHKIGFVFQTFHLVSRLSAFANVELPMVFAGVGRKERAERAESALQRVGLSARAEHVPAQLSGGERQRVAIARAVVMGPKLLLADEPTGNLDSASGAEVIGLLEEMNAKGLTLLVVTHDPNLGRRARRHVLMSDGYASEETAEARAAAEGPEPSPAPGEGGVRPGGPS
jgi:putative ABC transport system ATP-binding protein